MGNQLNNRAEATLSVLTLSMAALEHRANQHAEHSELRSAEVLRAVVAALRAAKEVCHDELFINAPTSKPARRGSLKEVAK
jgi:hypothetical protein